MASALPDRELEQSEVMSELAIFATHMKVSTDGGGLQWRDEAFE
jgi:hypothetical protein